MLLSLVLHNIAWAWQADGGWPGTGSLVEAGVPSSAALPAHRSPTPVAWQRFLPWNTN